MKWILIVLISCIYPYDDLEVYYDYSETESVIYSYEKPCGIEIQELEDDYDYSNYEYLDQ